MLPISRLAQSALAIAVAASIAGCGTNVGGVRIANLGREVPVSEAFITPPPGGPGVVAVLENRYANALAQDIILENNSSVAGQNVIYVRAFGPMGQEGGRERLEEDVLELRTIRRELIERFPGIHMEVSGLYAQNRYGPFSYAVGRTRGGTTCVYAWQRISAESRVFAFERGAITWRLRVCEPNTDARSLLLLAYGLTINGYFMSKRWNPYGAPPPPDPRIGQPGETILPEQPVDPTVVPPVAFGGEPRTSIRAPVRRSVRVEAQPVQPVRREPANEPLPGAAVVPRPQDTILDEPEVEGSNLPELAPRPAVRLNVPTPPTGPAVPGVRPGAPTIAPPPPQGARIIAPQSPGAPTVRVVGFDN